MSRNFYVYCSSCRSRHELGVNHGDAQMRAWVRHASAIAALFPLMREPSADVSLQTYDQYVDVAWFHEHHTHPLSVIDEYGRLLDQCSRRIACAGCDRLHDCFRKQGHEGECSPRERDRHT